MLRTRALVLMTAMIAGLSGCLGDNCRPSRGWDGAGYRHHGGDHHCDRDRGHRHGY